MDRWIKRWINTNAYEDEYTERPGFPLQSVDNVQCSIVAIYKNNLSWATPVLQSETATAAGAAHTHTHTHTNTHTHRGQRVAAPRGFGCGAVNNSRAVPTTPCTCASRTPRHHIALCRRASGAMGAPQQQHDGGGDDAPQQHQHDHLHHPPRPPPPPPHHHRQHTQHNHIQHYKLSPQQEQQSCGSDQQHTWRVKQAAATTAAQPLGGIAWQQPHHPQAHSQQDSRDRAMAAATQSLRGTGTQGAHGQMAQEGVPPSSASGGGGAHVGVKKLGDGVLASQEQLVKGVVGRVTAGGSGADLLALLQRGAATAQKATGTQQRQPPVIQVPHHNQQSDTTPTTTHNAGTEASKAARRVVEGEVTEPPAKAGGDLQNMFGSLSLQEISQFSNSSAQSALTEHTQREEQQQHRPQLPPYHFFPNMHPQRAHLPIPQHFYLPPSQHHLLYPAFQGQNASAVPHLYLNQHGGKADSTASHTNIQVI